MTVAGTHRPDDEAGPEERDFAPAVYGALLVTTLVAVQWRHDADPELIGLSLLTSVAVFWLAHSWSRIVDRRVHGPIGLGGVVDVARSEISMLSAVVVPGLILALPRVTGLGVDVAIGLALLASLVQLFLWGLVVGRAAHASWPLALGVAAVDCALGILVVILKVVVIH